MASPPSPLAGKRIVVTRAVEQSNSLCAGLRARGAVVTALPMVEFAPAQDSAPLDAALRDLSKFDWMLLTSQNAVRYIAERSREMGIDLPAAARSLQVGVVGPATAESAEKAGWRVAHVAATHQGVALVEELAGQLRGTRVFLPRSDRANPALPEALTRIGARVTEVIAYRTLAASALEDESRRRIEAGEVDAILFFSPSAVHHLAELVGAERLATLQDRIIFAAIGPVTTAALRASGVERVLIAPDTSVSAILDSLADHWPAKTHAGAKRE
jgi:uroporphyrinogen-III synthase